MASPLRAALLLVLAAGTALLIGLTGTTLRTGWIDPLGWLLPGALALILLMIRARRGDGESFPSSQIVRFWAVIALPIMLFCVTAGLSQPWLAVGLFGFALGLIALGVIAALRLAPVVRWPALLALVALAAVVPRLTNAWPATTDDNKPLVGIMTAMPLQGVAMGASLGVTAIESVGMRSPLWTALEGRARLRSLDAIDTASLSGLDALLLAQPRLLTPAELVALDAWVRGGGRVVILADPLLHWSDPRPLGHPARAPLTSLLDPLLSHWGLRLEAAEVDMARDQVERRAVAGGLLLQLSGSSRFTAHGPAAGCTVSEAGLLAECHIGQGRALLVADADWINDMLWTLDAAQPADRSAWTSDAIDLLEAWLTGQVPRLARLGAWLDEGRVVPSLRVSIIALLLLAIANWLVGRRPKVAPTMHGSKEDQKWNIGKTNLDTT